MLSKLFIVIADRFGREHGCPLPQRLLEIGDQDQGWHVALNPTAKPIGDVDAFTARVCWNGWPAGIIDPGGGLLAAGSLANEQTLLEWLDSDVAQGSEENDGK